MTSFTRIVIVLSFLRQAIGTPTLPPTQVIVGLSLFLTFFIMGPTIEKIHVNALSPYMNNKIAYEEFVDKSSKEIGTFMFKFARDKDVALFVNIAGLQRPKNESEIPFRVLVPAFAISELKRAFQIGFLLYIPFLIIDMVVASVLLLDRHDDAAPHLHIAAVQADALRSRRRLESTCRLTGQRIPVIWKSTESYDSGLPLHSDATLHSRCTTQPSAGYPGRQRRADKAYFGTSRPNAQPTMQRQRRYALEGEGWS